MLFVFISRGAVSRSTAGRIAVQSPDNDQITVREGYLMIYFSLLPYVTFAVLKKFLLQITVSVVMGNKFC